MEKSATMGEVTKQARLDNWAMFVMSRLQVFFNTTDYCDLTLQFEGNVQLKVHRVIMNACTEYFRLLEQECDMDGDILIMPPDLQADVILPIVNFMYTGILEYQQSIFERLYQTAELMNMSVLLKFLDAQRAKVKTSPKIMHAAAQGRKVKVEKLAQPMPMRKLPLWKRKSAPLPVQVNPVKPYSPDTKSSLSFDGCPRFDNAPKPTRFEWPDDDMQDIKPFDLMPLDSSFDSISYSSKPFCTQEEEMRSNCNSTVFDDLRQLPGGKVSKHVSEARDKASVGSSVDMEDLKSYVKEQKIRSNLADCEDEEDPDDPDYVVGGGDKKRKVARSPVAAKKLKVSREKENIVEVRATSTKVDHTKIISEVFKKYPHLVQKNKNIRLKILPKKSDDKPAAEKDSPKPKSVASTATPQPVQLKKVAKPSPASSADFGSPKKTRSGEQTWVCATCSNHGEPVEFVLYYLYRKHLTDAHNKQFDARECKHCGDLYELPLQMTYHMYMAHAVVPPRNVNFPKCARCSFVALDQDVMTKHLNFHAMHAHHVQCTNCKLGFTNAQTLKAHMQLAGHNGRNNLSFDCQYCTRQLNSAASLFVHCKTTHSEDSKRDGMLSLDLQHLEEPAEIEKEASSQPIDEDIASSLGSFDIVVMDDQQQFILQGEQDASSQIGDQQGFMTLPSLQDQSYNVGQTDIGSTDELVMVLTDHEYNDGGEDAIINNDNSNIVVLYSHPVDGQQNQFITSQGNIMLNSETGMLEIHNDGVPISTQGESIEMIQKEIQSHALSSATDVTTTTGAQKLIATPVEVDHHEELAKGATGKKVIAVEAKGTGQLIGTIEEIDHDTTDSAAQNAEQPEPEPMDIDEDTKNIGGLETSRVQSTEEIEPISIEPELMIPAVVPRVDATAQEESSGCSDVTATREIQTLEIIVKDEVSSVVEDRPPSAKSIHEIAEVEVLQELLEPAVSETPGVLAETSETLGVAPLKTESDLISQTAPDNDDEYKTSASLSVSDQCPEEPMEVDGVLQAQSETSTLQEAAKNDGYNGAVDDDVDEQAKQEVSETSGDVVDGQEESKESRETQESHEQKAEPEDTLTRPVEADSFPEGPIQPAESTLSTESSTLEKEEVNTENLVESESTGSTLYAIGSLSESMEEPPLDDNIEESHPPPAAEETLPTSADDASEPTEIKGKTEGISTLLNDWEDTDSQTSEQGKAATVDKLINDWDDE